MDSRFRASVQLEVINNWGNIKMNNKNIFNWIILFSFVTFLTACGGTSSQKTPTVIPMTYPTAEYSGIYTVVQSGNTEINIGSPGTLPNQLPRDVPVYYPGFTTGWTMNKVSGKVSSINVMIEAPDDYTTVMNWYKSALESNRWTFGPSSVEMGSIVCQNEEPEIIDAKKDNQAIRVSVCPSPCSTNCKTGISLSFSEIE